MKKYLKMMVVFSLVLVLPMLAIGCGNGQAKNEKVENSNTPAAKRAEAADVTSQNATSASKEEAKSASSQEEAKSATSEKEAKNADVNKDIQNDPYEMYLATDEWKNMDEWEKGFGLEAYCVEKNGNEYILGPLFRPDLIKKFNVGYLNPALSRPSRFMYLYAADTTPTSYGSPPETNTFITVGDVPIIQIKRAEEKIRGYHYTELVLYKTEFKGYTIPVYFVQRSVYDNKGMSPIINHCLTQNDANIALYPHTNYGICDLSENPVEDARNLNYGDEYIVYWYTGTNYNEVKMKADCKVFEKNSDKPDYTINGNLTKNGYAEFDLSDVEPGYYIIMRGGIVGIIEIVN